jgi:predicted Zn-dependent protease
MLHWLKRALPHSLPNAGSSARSRAALLRKIRRIEHSPDPADVSTVARLWNQLATLAETEGDREAPTYFGRAIDAYLEGGYFSAASAMCTRLIRLHPEVVRARCTRAFLAIGRKQFADAIQDITEYTLASKRTGTERFAIPRLRLMAEATSDVGVRRRIAVALGELGDEEGREQVQISIHQPEESADDARRWERLLAVALLNREQLRRPVAPHPEPMALGAIPHAVWEAA